MGKNLFTENMEYQAPEVEIVEVAIERGFNYSIEGLDEEKQDW